MPNLIRDHSLSITMFGIFAATLLGMSLVGWQNYNNDQQDHKQDTVDYVGYLKTPNFGEAVFENWESEFLQMGAYVILTVMLFQRGSSESKDPDTQESVDEDPEDKKNQRGVPWPVRRGGLALLIYKHSLTIALFALFFFSFAMHAVTGASEYSDDQKEHGGKPVTAIEYLGTSRFWFESLQNWQSEFLAVGTLIVLSIVLRQQGSSESKPVAAKHTDTGN